MDRKKRKEINLKIVTMFTATNKIIKKKKHITKYTENTDSLKDLVSFSFFSQNDMKKFIKRFQKNTNSTYQVHFDSFLDSK